MMAKLIYSTLMSLDGYVADERGNFDWAVPSDEVHAFINDLQRSIGTHLYGRRLYEVMRAWETMDTLPDQPAVVLDFAAIWQAADKIVYSRTLGTVSTGRTRLERSFNPQSVRRMKDTSDRDLLIGGPELAAHAFAAGLVDDIHLFLAPVIVGGGTRALPDRVRLDLELAGERRFANGMVYVHHRALVRAVDPHQST
jgi:dihydrofolate reductase